MKWLKKIALIVCSIMFVMAAGGYWYLHTHEEEIKQYAMGAIQDQLVSEYSVEDIQLTFWDHFPQ
ncbi:MAG: hypothetical protein AAF193_01265, partial [Bacteroidota bacterium]